MGLLGETNCTAESEYLPVGICCAGGSGTILSAGTTVFGWDGPFPAIDEGANEHAMAVVYLILLLWLFLGVALAADVFMAAIEQITSQTSTIKQRALDGSTKIFRVHTWNPTVANLTLMALGSSAPEILLSIIELLAAEFYSGDLGPSTIVGSAAFNLLVIIAVCVVSIPEGESRKIAQPVVYSITAFASVFAYVWLIIILLVWTPDQITLPEAILTFAFFPLLVLFAYYADKWKDAAWRRRHPLFSKCIKSAGASLDVLPSEFLLDIKNPDGTPLSNKELMAMVKQLQRTHGLKMPEDKAVEALAQQMASTQPKSRAYYRVNATRGMKGVGSSDGQGSVSRTRLTSKKSAMVVPEEVSTSAKGPVIEFAAPRYAVIEAAGTVTVQVVLRGELSKPCSVKYISEDGEGEAAATAADGDYEAVEGTLEFAPGETSKEVTVKIFDDDKVEPDEHFFLRLHPPADSADVSLGAVSRTRITIINDDFPGTFVFAPEDLTTKESAGEALIEIQRVQGCSGRVSLQWKTIDGTAIDGKNYHGASGTLTWEHMDVKSKMIQIGVIDDDIVQGKQYFEVEISGATGGAIFDETTDGDKERSIARVTIEDDEVARSIADRAIAMLGMNQQQLSLSTDSWKEQFIAARHIEEGSGIGTYVMHYVALPFKLLCAFVPPSALGGGWPCFVVAISVIGILTALIGDLANLLGCALGLKGSCVAITLVALGTSLPDTFASRAAARGDPTADAAIGNVTGSNAVNVFLGLGLSWVVGAAYWTSSGATESMIARYSLDPKLDHLIKDLRVGDPISLIVPAGDLAISVTIFVVCAVCCLSILTVRRLMLGGELGLQHRKKTAAVLCGLWLAYIVLSCNNPFGS